MLQIKSVRRVTKEAYKKQHTECSQRALENAAEWSTLHPYEFMRDFFAAMTQEELTAHLERMYPDNPSNAERVPLDRLYRGNKN